MKKSRTLSLIGITVLVSGLALSTTATAAVGAGAGYGDVSDAMIYGAAGPVGTVIPEFIDEDDVSTTVAAPFAINFFGTKYEGLCLTTNGTISPVLTPTDTCSDDYDEDVANLALDSQAPVIAALALDLDPSEDLWVPGVSVAAFEVTAGVATITTTAPHPFAVNDQFHSWFPIDDPSFAADNQAAVDSVPTPNSFTFATSLPDEPVRAVAGASVSIGDYIDDRDDTNADGLADDGFGAVKQVYFGTTTVAGKQAVVLTWYRVPTNDRNNSPLLSNTLQVVIIQEPTANAATAGSDFTIQINIGTATDNDDGYSAADPADSCDSAPSDPSDGPGIIDCRWGMGWANYDAATGTADPYELFASSPINDLVDSAGTTALVNNRLNSTVLGRYTWQMIGGVTVGFAVPTMNGSDAGVAAIAAPNAPTLAATGTDSLAVVWLGLLLAAGGLGLIVVVRRRDSSRA